MAVSLTAAFFKNARGLTLKDAGGITWSLNANTNEITGTTGGGGGALTSVGLSDSSTAPIYTVGNSPLTANGTLTITLSTQAANLILAGPTTGAAAQPTFRGLVAADIPTIPYTSVSGLATVAHTGAYGDLSGTPAIPVGGNPTAKVALAVVNGSAATWMRSDGAPALDVSIVPTWTGLHTFNATVVIAKPSSGTALTVGDTTAGLVNAQIGRVLFATSLNFDAGDAEIYTANGTGANLNIAAAGALKLRSNFTLAVTIDTSQKVTCAGPIGVNNAAPPAQVTGWGTPVGGAVVASYNITDPGGANSNTNKALAKIIADLKAIGFYAA